MTADLFRTRYALPMAVLLLLCVLAYSNALGHRFIIDDYEVLFDRIMVKEGIDADFFTRTVNGFYRPVGAVFLKLTSLLSGFNTTGYHLVNLSIFYLITVLFMLIVDILLARRETPGHSVWSIPFVTAALFCVHPVNNMIVNYATASLLGIATLCMQASFLLFVLHLRNENRLYFAGSVVFYLTGLFTHEMVTVFPVYLLASVVLLRADKFRRTLLLFVPYLVCLALYGVVRAQFNARPVGALFDYQVSPGIYWATISELLQWYIGKLLLPVQLLFLWDVKVQGGHILGRCLWLGAFIAACGGLGLWLIRTRRWFDVFCLFLFLAGLVPMGLAAFTYTATTTTAIIEPHWFYFTSMGFFALAARLLAGLFGSWNRWVHLVVTAGLIFVLALMTRQSNLVWANETTYCTYWIGLNPNNLTPYHGLRRLEEMSPQQPVPGSGNKFFPHP